MTPSDPLAYLLTWTCYGSWLHGDARGSVDSGHNIPGEPVLPPDEVRRQFDTERMTQPAYVLDAVRREIVLGAVLQDANYRGWRLHAVHVRSRHVHVVITATAKPERVLNDLKAYASRRLNEAGIDSPDRKRWTRHGSTRYLWTEDSVVQAVDYVLHRQGEPLSAHPPPDPQRLAELANPTEPRPSGELTEPRPQGSVWAHAPRSLAVAARKERSLAIAARINPAGAAAGMHLVWAP